MKLWIHLLYSSLLASVSSQSQSTGSSARGSCDSLCNCEEKDGTILINCEEKGIKTLSQISVPPSRPFHLSLLNNGLTMLHTNGFSGLRNAISIHLGFNNIADIETGAFNGLDLLKQLHINHNSLEILKEDTFHGLENLEFLQADNNFITVIEPSAFSKLNRLKVLILNDNAIESLPANIFRFVPLTHLDLRGNQLQTLPYVGFLEHIGRILDLQLEDNKWACNCDLLQLKIWLENMPPQSIIGDVVCNSPPVFKGSILSRLKRESICPIPPVYEEHEDPSGSLHLAVTSSISDGRMLLKTTSPLKPPTKAPGLTPYIPKPSTQLPGPYCPIPCNCKELSPSGLLIHCQERNIESVSDLKPPPQDPRKLILAGNIIHALMKSDLVEYDTLEMLHLGNNHIEVLEEGSFMNLTRLQKLYLNGNHLTKLSKAMFLGLHNLEYLYLEYNAIKEILPETFNPMPKLRVLYLNNNLLQVLPPHIFSGVPLTRINLKMNHLTHLPVSNLLDDLDLLTQIDLEDNPWDCSCDLVGLQQWIQKLNKNTATDDILCTSPEHLAKKELKALNSELLCPGLVNNPALPTQTSYVIVSTPTADTILRSLTDAVPLSVLILGLLIVFITIVFCAAGIVVLVLHRRRRYKKKQADEQIRDSSPVHLQYSMYGHKTTHHTTERPTASLYEQHMVSPMVHVYRSPSFGPKHLEAEEEKNEKEGSDAKHLQRSLLERENHSPLTGSNMKYKTTDQSTEFLSFQDASSLYRNILEKERELQQLGITEYLKKNIAQLKPDMEVHYPGAHEELKLMETLMYSRPRKVLVEQTKNEYFELKANLHAEPDYLEVLEQQT
ncbi:SLIT and NTRK-like protein 6 [Pipistrellus kuhlii]|uniref:SLIT and NTRK like family member 6 n=1 Tax=Pipistrellus kuhlii TaxID=59472 RepID=A0A7J7ZNR7_PIPKU|nr:SLIT and NTRK-like protein 6 [Pipistrellus kuhlii]KAF6375360.1 SLIT and NTRK like family member 6 [Pipistrellus kuhlii]